MILLKKANDLRNYIDSQRKNGKPIGFIPTMGALHQGHISLIEAAKSRNQLTVCSIFVNPTQFNDPSDFEKYPVTTDTDIAQLLAAGNDVLFLPELDEIYPAGIKPIRIYELGQLETILEGKYRPGHFQGVCQVVHRLLDIVQPDLLFLGQKDYQQCMVISRLIELTGYADRITIQVCPTLREKDGLAMSSRNRRLSVKDRHTATTIFRTLSFIQQHLRPGDLTALHNKAVAALSAAGFRVDYVSISDARTLHPCTDWDGQQQLVALVAAFLDEVRLIDNLPLTNAIAASR